MNHFNIVSWPHQNKKHYELMSLTLKTIAKKILIKVHLNIAKKIVIYYNIVIL